MKKLKSIICLAIIFICSSVLLTACGSSVKFKIKFMVDNEEYAVVDTAGNETISMPENPAKENYIFDGWYWDENVWQNPFTANSLLDQPLNSDMKVYAKWSDDKELKGTKANFIDFEQVDNSTYKMSVSNTTEILNLSDYVEVNNKSSWQLTTDIQAINNIPNKIATLNVGDNTYYVVVTTENRDAKLYTLNIRRRQIYTVSFGEYAEPQYIEEDDYVVQPDEPKSPKGHTFRGWNFDFNNKIQKNEYIVPVWTANKYEIEYCSNNDFNDKRTIEVTYGKKFTIPGYDFFKTENQELVGFNSIADGTGIKYSLNKEYLYDLDCNLILYAIWNLPTEQQQWLNYRNKINTYNLDAISKLQDLGTKLSLWDDTTDEGLGEEIKTLWVDLVSLYSLIYGLKPCNNYANPRRVAEIYKPIIELNITTKHASSMDLEDIKNFLMDRKYVRVNLLINIDDENHASAFKLIDWAAYGSQYVKNLKSVADVYNNNIESDSLLTNISKDSLIIDMSLHLPIMDGILYFVRDEYRTVDNTFCANLNTNESQSNLTLMNNSYWSVEGISICGQKIFFFYEGTQYMGY